MVWIETDNDACQRLTNADVFDGAIEFSDQGTANVDRETAEAVTDHYDDIQYKNR